MANKCANSNWNYKITKKLYVYFQPCKLARRAIVADSNITSQLDVINAGI